MKKIKMLDPFWDLPLTDKMLVKFRSVLGLLGPHRCHHSNQEVENPLGTYSKPLGSPWNPFYNHFWFSKSRWALRDLRGEPIGALGGSLMGLKGYF